MKKVTEKTKEQLLQTEWEELTFDEQLLKSILERTDMSLEEAIESLDMIP